MPDTTPGPIDRFLTDLETSIQKHLPARDSRWWQVSYWSALLIFAANHTHLFPASWHDPMLDFAALLGFVGGKMGWSSAKAPEKPENQ